MHFFRIKLTDNIVYNYYFFVRQIYFTKPIKVISKVSNR